MKFSVAMCVYNNDNYNYFDVALESIVLKQTVLPNEVVLVVDGPINNNIQAVIDKYLNIYLHLRVIYLENNVGHGRARQIGMESCVYDYIAIMDSDDISKYDRFEQQIKYFEKYSFVSVVGGNILEFSDNESNIVGERIVPQEDENIKKYIKKRCPFNQVTVMFKKKDVADVGGYVDWYCNEDYYLWIRMYQKGYVFKNIDSCLVNVRVDKNTYKRRGGWNYFKSEMKLQGYMYSNKIIKINEYLNNILVRFIVQLLLPTKIREIVFKRFARVCLKTKS